MYAKLQFFIYRPIIIVSGVYSKVLGALVQKFGGGPLNCSFGFKTKKRHLR